MKSFQIFCMLAITQAILLKIPLLITLPKPFLLSKISKKEIAVENAKDPPILGDWDFPPNKIISPRNMRRMGRVFADLVRRKKQRRLLNMIAEQPSNYTLMELEEDKNPDNIIFELFTEYGQVNQERLISRKPETLKKSSLNADKKIVVIVHGFLENTKNSPWIVDLRKKFLTMDYNVIQVDWGFYVSDIDRYEYAAAASFYAGDELALLLHRLEEVLGAKSKELYLVGFSLGAHVCGFAGKSYTKIDRITGLDPADPMFDYDDKRKRLDKTDAKFVDVVHTSDFGMIENIGHVDFRINDGRSQKPYPNDYFMLQSHRFAWKIYNISLSHPNFFKGFRCNDYDEFIRAQCMMNENNYLGIAADISRPGLFFVLTSELSPLFRPHYYVATVRYEELIRNAKRGFSLKLQYDQPASNTNEITVSNVARAHKTIKSLDAKAEAIPFDDETIQFYFTIEFSSKAAGGTVRIASVKYEDLSTNKTHYTCQHSFDLSSKSVLPVRWQRTPCPD